MKIRNVLLAATGLVVLGGGYYGYRLAFGKPISINHFYERSMIELVLGHPQLLTQLGLVENTWLDFHSGKLDDVSPAQEERDADKLEAQLRMLRSYDVASQTADQRLSTTVLDWFIDDQVRGRPFMYHRYPVTQLFGEHTELVDFMVQQHRVESAFSAKRYIARLSMIGAHMDQLLASLKTREERKLVPPRWSVDEVVAQIEGLLKPEPAKHILVTSFEERLGKIKDMPAAERADLVAQATRAVSEQFYPAYRRLLEYERGLATRARTTDGVWDLPDGTAYYAWKLRHETTTELAPERVHELGLAEVARLTAEIEPILAAHNAPGATLGARIQALAHDPAYAFSNDAAGREKILAGYRALLDAMWDKLPTAFATLPAQKPEVKAVPDFKAENAPGAYYQPQALDGGRPGVFFANLRHPDETARWTMPTLAYHEGLPGHHLQTAIAIELKHVPTFRRVLPFTAYMEGWALYAERLAKEMGFETDDLDNLGRLQAEMFRAVRLVVDTGIHAKRWTREQAIAYMTDHTGMGTNEVRAEIERYIVDPGQACAYKVGMLKILDLRERARAALGPKFDLKAFHSVVLGAGAMPLDVLETRVDDWVKAGGAKV